MICQNELLKWVNQPLSSGALGLKIQSHYICRLSHLNHIVFDSIDRLFYLLNVIWLKTVILVNLVSNSINIDQIRQTEYNVAVQVS